MCKYCWCRYRILLKFKYVRERLWGYSNFRRRPSLALKDRLRHNCLFVYWQCSDYISPTTLQNVDKSTIFLVFRKKTHARSVLYAWQLDFASSIWKTNMVLACDIARPIKNQTGYVWKVHPVPYKYHIDITAPYGEYSVCNGIVGRIKRRRLSRRWDISNYWQKEIKSLLTDQINKGSAEKICKDS